MRSRWLLVLPLASLPLASVEARTSAQPPPGRKLTWRQGIQPSPAPTWQRSGRRPAQRRAGHQARPLAVASERAGAVSRVTDVAPRERQRRTLSRLTVGGFAVALSSAAVAVAGQVMDHAALTGGGLAAAVVAGVLTLAVAFARQGIAATGASSANGA